MGSALFCIRFVRREHRIDESVRHSSLFGFHRIKQIVLEAPLDADREIAWIFTLDEG